MDFEISHEKILYHSFPMNNHEIEKSILFKSLNNYK